MSEKNESVGYGKPPKQYRFLKGTSGNPGGRPRRQPTFAECVYAEMNRIYTLTVDGKKQQLQGREVMARNLVTTGMKSDIAAIKECCRQESSLGAADQVIEVTVCFPEEEERQRLQNRSL